MVPGIVLKFRAIITVQAGEFDTLLSNTIDAMSARFAKSEDANIYQFAAECRTTCERGAFAPLTLPRNFLRNHPIDKINIWKLPP